MKNGVDIMNDTEGDQPATILLLREASEARA